MSKFQKQPIFTNAIPVDKAAIGGIGQGEDYALDRLKRRQFFLNNLEFFLEVSNYYRLHKRIGDNFALPSVEVLKFDDSVEGAVEIDVAS